MIFSIEDSDQSVVPLEESDFSDMGFSEREDIQEWAIEEPRLLGEDLLVVSSEYSDFEDTRDRLDILALDENGKLVVVELKRDRADRTTDLQAIKYAGYCATLTARDVQKEYRDFWNDKRGEDIAPEDVGSEFSDFLIEEVDTNEDGWADFELDDKPRIILAAGTFGTEITAPVMWLIEEYGMDITCTRLQPYERDGTALLNSQQVIPPDEAEDYMTQRREKKKEQETPEPTEQKKLQKEFWTEFHRWIQENSSVLSARKPRAQHYYQNPIGRAHMHISFVNYIKEGELHIRLRINDDEDTYYELEEEKQAIEDEMGEKMTWREPEETRAGNMISVIGISREADIRDQEKWDEYLEWMGEYGERFHEVFGDRI